MTEWGTKKEIRYIYGLVDPISKLLIYVGSTNNPMKRLSQHSARYAEKYKRDYICELKSRGYDIELVILECLICRRGDDRGRESWFIGMAEGQGLFNCDYLSSNFQHCKY